MTPDQERLKVHWHASADSEVLLNDIKSGKLLKAQRGVNSHLIGV